MSWLQRHSSIWRRLHPPVAPVLPKCEGCGGPAPASSLCGDHPHHSIGRVNYSDKGERIICCDGSEDHE